MTVEPIGLEVRRRGPGEVSLRLSGELGLGCLGWLEEALEEGLCGARRVLVDASAITFIDGACLALLAAARLRHPGRVSLEAASYQLRLAAAACGLEEWLGIVPLPAPGLREVPR